MDKEAQARIRKRVALQFNGVSSLMLQETYGASLRLISEQIVSDFIELGYRKLPRDKPPLLSKDTLAIKIQDGLDKVGKGEIASAFTYIAQAQREADIKHYEGL